MTAVTATSTSTGAGAGLAATLRLQAGALAVSAVLSVGEGATVAVVGPNGAGKTSILRGLAGLLPVGAGSRVTLDGVVLDDPERWVHVPAEQRPVAVVFQDLALFPHLDARDNVAFGLRHRSGLPAAAARARASAWLERVGLGEVAGLRPHQLSGGQAQRVALARALAPEPRLLLLDEPLASLDVQARAGMRALLRSQLASVAGARVLVTHDPVEASALADHIVVVEGGDVTQRGTPAELARSPRTRYIAELVGLNFFRGTARNGVLTLAGGATVVVAGPADGEVVAVAHPHAVALHAARPEGTPRNVWSATVVDVERVDGRARIVLDGPVPLVAEVTDAAAAELGAAPGRPVWASLKATEIDVYPA